MSKRGKKIVDASKSFGKANRQIGSTITRITAAIRERKIGDKERKLFREFYASLDNQFELFVGKQFETNKKGKFTTNTATGCYMNVEQNPDGEIDYGLFSPTYIHYTLTDNTLIVESRKFPLAFAADHVEFRFNENPDKELPLRYSWEQIKRTMVTALLLSRTLPEVDLLYGETATPVILPHQDGIFSGYAERINPSSYNFHGSQSHKSNGRFKSSQGEAEPGNTSWSPSCRIIIKTFVPNKDLKPNQERLRTAMLDLIKGPKHSTGLSQIRHPYITRYNYKDQNSEEVAAVEKELLDIIESSDWDQVRHYGQKHLPANKWKPNGWHKA